MFKGILNVIFLGFERKRIIFNVIFFCCRVFRKFLNRLVKLKKYKVIVKVFEKRKELNNGRFFISFVSIYEDLLGKIILFILK